MADSLSMKVLNFGSLNIDRIYRTDGFVAPGETKTVLEHLVEAGGKGLNQSIALARAGAEVEHVGYIGEDGRFLEKLLADSGVRPRLGMSAKGSGHAIIEVDASGENRILIVSGANHSFDRTSVSEIMDTEPCWILLQNEINMIGDIIRLAKQRGHRVCQNVAPISACSKDYPLELLDLLIVNEGEALALAGKADLQEAVLALRGLSDSLEIVVTLGKEGAISLGRSGRCRERAFSVSAVDTTAAGDTFVGYYLAQRIRGSDLGLAMRTACAASALSVQKLGAAVSIPTESEVEAFLARQA